MCQLHMRHFKDNDSIFIEPFRAKAFPVIKDLVVDRSALTKIIQSGGYISVHTGGVPDANAVLIPKQDADTAMDAAECIGCGACVAACPNGSAMLFTAAKVSQLAVLPQGKNRGCQTRLRNDRGDAQLRGSATAATTMNARPSARKASRQSLLQR